MIFIKAKDDLQKLVPKYLTGELAREEKGRPEETKRRKRLTEVVKDAWTLLYFLEKETSLLADGAYGTGENRRVLSEEGSGTAAPQNNIGRPGQREIYLRSG